MTEKKNKMTQPQIEKVTVNIGVGEGGEKLRKAEKVLENVTGQKPLRTISKTTNKELGIRKDMPIGCKVTLRGEKAQDFLSRAFDARENKIAGYSFDHQGNLSFGIPDHTLFKGQKYDPDTGIFGMDVNVTLEKPGHRIKKRRVEPRKIPTSHKVSWEEAMDYLSEKFNLEVIE